MKKEKIKVYIYTRVSTAMQIDGYSLDAQKSRMKAFADFNDYEIVGEYEDAGKSGKSIEGRIQFNQMMEDIKSGKDGVSYVLVFKLSRFGRNAADVLSTLQVMQDFGVNLICHIVRNSILFSRIFKNTHFIKSHFFDEVIKVVEMFLGFARIAHDKSGSYRNIWDFFSYFVD